MPKRRKNRSIGEPCGNGGSSLDAGGARRSRSCTRTEITAGFTFSTMSAKPIGRGSLRACCGQVLRMRDAGKAGLRQKARRGEQDRQRRGRRRWRAAQDGDAARSGDFGAGMSLGFMISLRLSSGCAAPQRCVATEDGDAPPYRVLAARLNFGKVEVCILLNVYSITYPISHVESDRCAARLRLARIHELGQSRLLGGGEIPAVGLRGVSQAAPTAAPRDQDKGRARRPATRRAGRATAAPCPS